MLTLPRPIGFSMAAPFLVKASKLRTSAVDCGYYNYCMKLTSLCFSRSAVHRIVSVKGNLSLKWELSNIPLEFSNNSVVFDC